jgi:hemerythrin
MAKFQWDESLNVGIDLINEQHKMLIQKINDLSDAVENVQGAESIVQTLDFLIEYTDFHFGTEEKHMEELNYPAMNAHKTAHAEFKDTLKNLYDDFDEEGATQPIAESINTFMINWLIKHIKVIDVEFGKFLIEKGSADIKE